MGDRNVSSWSDLRTPVERRADLDSSCSGRNSSGFTSILWQFNGYVQLVKWRNRRSRFLDLRSDIRCIVSDLKWCKG